LFQIILPQTGTSPTGNLRPGCGNQRESDGEKGNEQAEGRHCAEGQGKRTKWVQYKTLKNKGKLMKLFVSR
jgi:hypothetical protein